MNKKHIDCGKNIQSLLNYYVQFINLLPSLPRIVVIQLLILIRILWMFGPAWKGKKCEDIFYEIADQIRVLLGER